ncbi:hypothetical protein BC629DRAFT_1473385 [Irpex lacteus]|nr:hypothetical protein BC629DRAFT_1473385 [Irpex lacteus]
MALPMLVNGADCGPLTLSRGFRNSLIETEGFSSGLIERGMYHNFLRYARSLTCIDQDAARFFSGGSGSTSAAPAPFDLSLLNNALPTTSSYVPMSAHSSKAWTLDFIQKTPNPSAPFHPLFANGMHSMSFQQPLNIVSPGPHLATETPPTHADSSRWEEAFATHELPAASTEAVQEARAHKADDPDALARAAGSLMEAVQNEENPKFKNSAFLGLMKQLRDHEVTVEGDKMVPKEGVSAQGINGKGRAVDPSMTFGGSSATFNSSTAQPMVLRSAEEEIDEYFRQENDAAERHPGLPAALQAQQAEWDRLQNDWSRFEATATGIRPISNYQFAQNNPYLHSQTRHHALHAQGAELSLYESVLQMEAAVQRDPTNVEAWYSLGVKQQENEREAKAIHALRRALELDPNHLPSWVALAISHTNEGNRSGAYEAIQSWVTQNERYKDAVDAFRSHMPERDDMTQHEKFAYLTDCLIHMSRSAEDDIDADIQIALAVLMNTNEAYDKAKDCFLIALAMRPEDPQLYNRVGATLANSGQASEALQYYYKALELNPAYIRARYILSLSLLFRSLTLFRYQEASSHILDALALQEADAVRNSDGTDDKRGVTSTALWDSLKTCCLHLRRLDLASLCDRRDLEAFQLNYQMA